MWELRGGEDSSTMAYPGLLVPSKLLKKKKIIFTCSIKQSLAVLGLRKNSKFQLKTLQNCPDLISKYPEIFSSQDCTWAVRRLRAQCCRARKRGDRAESGNSWLIQKESTGNDYWPSLLIQDVKTIWWKDGVAGLETNKGCTFPPSKSLTLWEPKVQMR